MGVREPCQLKENVVDVVGVDGDIDVVMDVALPESMISWALEMFAGLVIVVDVVDSQVLCGVVGHCGR